MYVFWYYQHILLKRSQEQAKKLRTDYILHSKAVKHAEFIALQEILASGVHRPQDVVLYVTVEPCVMYVINGDEN